MRAGFALFIAGALAVTEMAGVRGDLPGDEGTGPSAYDLPASEVVAAYARMAVTDSCSASCVECGWFCEDCYKVIEVEPGTGALDGDQTYGCVDVPCPPPLLYCPGYPDEEPLMRAEELDRLWSAIASDDLEYVREVIKERDRVNLNADRRAVQVRACGKRVVAHIPLTRQQLRVLGE